MKIAVVALGKIGLPLAVQFAEQGPRGRRRRRQPAGRRPGQRRARAVPRRGRTSPRSLARAGARRAGCARRPTTPTRSPGADAVVVVVPLFVDDETGSPTSAGWTPPPSAIAAAPDARAPWSPTRRRCRSAPPAPAGSRCSRRAPASPRARTSTSSSAPSGCSPAGSSPTCASTPSSSAACREEGAAKARRVLRGRCSTSTSAPTSPRRNGVWDLGSRRGRRAGQARRDHLPRRQHRPGQPVRALRRARTASTCTQVIEASQLPALQPHPPPGHRRRRPLHPGLPAAVPLERPRRDRGARGPRGQRRRCPSYAVGLLEGAYGDLTGARVAGARRRLPRRRQGDGVLRVSSRRSTALRAARRRRRSCTTRCTPTRSSASSASSAYHLGEPVDAAVVQADHAEYRDLDARRPARREGPRRRPPGHRPGPLPGRHAPRHRSRAALSP